jgi:hypothetical protein
MVARKKESPIFYLIGVPANFNLWGERSTSKYLLLKRGFSTYTRIVPARESPYFLCAMRQSLRVTSPNPTSWVRAVCVGCAMRGVRGARCARENLAGRDMRAYGAGEAAEPPTAQQTTPKSRSGISSKTTSREKTLRFCSKTVPSSKVACYDSQNYILRKVTALPPLPTN